MDNDPNLAAWQDDQYDEHRVKEVTKADNGYEIRCEAFSLFLASDDSSGVVPKAGQTVRIWGKGFFAFRGLAFDGQIAFYRSQEEDEARRRQEVIEQKVQRMNEYEAERDSFNARVEALPDPLRLRVEGFREFGGDEWRWDYEPYEMASCEEAARIYRVCHGDEQQIQNFALLTPEQQRKRNPKMDTGHSGNTWGMAIRLAWLMARDDSLVPKEHAVICPLIGCKEAGCWAMRGQGEDD